MIYQWLLDTGFSGEWLLDHLPESEIKSAESELFRRTQLSAFPMELKDLKTGRTIESSSSLITLTPFLDPHGVLRVEGRIENAPVAPEVRHPIILPAHEKITELLIYSTHLEYEHSTPERTLNELRKLYWVQGGRKTMYLILVLDASETTQRLCIQ